MRSDVTLIFTLLIVIVELHIVQLSLFKLIIIEHELIIVELIIAVLLIVELLIAKLLIVKSPIFKLLIVEHGLENNSMKNISAALKRIGCCCCCCRPSPRLKGGGRPRAANQSPIRLFVGNQQLHFSPPNSFVLIHLFRR